MYKWESGSGYFSSCILPGMSFRVLSSRKLQEKLDICISSHKKPMSICIFQRYLQNHLDKYLMLSLCSIERVRRVPHGFTLVSLFPDHIWRYTLARFLHIIHYPPVPTNVKISGDQGNIPISGNFRIPPPSPCALSNSSSIPCPLFFFTFRCKVRVCRGPPSEWWWDRKHRAGPRCAEHSLTALTGLNLRWFGRMWMGF